MPHPARYSSEVLDVAFDILRHEWPDWMGRPLIVDPFAGTGERLHERCNRDMNDSWGYLGFEIEADFIEAPGIIHADATNPAVYPHPGVDAIDRWVILTSPVYSNGMCDNHRPRDTSKRRNYRAHKIEITGNPDAELDPANMGRYGYRGTKRPEDGGTSKRRAAYWDLAEKAVANWGRAEMALVNVSDFIYTRDGEEHIEPLVADWTSLLRGHGWDDITEHPVGTRRMKHGENADKRVDHEVVIVGRKSS